MIPAAFDYVRAGSAEEAIALIGEHGDEAKFLAGGHSLIPLMKLRLAQPTVLVDIGRVNDLSYIRDGGDHVAIFDVVVDPEVDHLPFRQQAVEIGRVERIQRFGRRLCGGTGGGRGGGRACGRGRTGQPAGRPAGRKLFRQCGRMAFCS